MFVRSYAATLLAVLCFAGSQALAEPSSWQAEGWTRTDFSRSAVSFDEILSGGPPKDGIPSIDDPLFVAVSDVSDIGPLEPVITLERPGEARAYPLRVLIWHEIVNDTLAGEPLAITYCPLCNSAVVFRRQHGDRVLDFGTTGKLRNSDLVMYDRQTETWWQQFSGEAIIGELTGATLKMVPSRVEGYAGFAKRHPNGKVLVPNNPAMRSYGRNPYVQYDARSAPYPLFVGDLPKDIPAMARVIVVGEGAQRFAVTLEALRKRGKAEIGEVTLHWEAGQNSALDAGVIAQGSDVGNVMANRTGSGEPVVHAITFAFVVNAFYPDLEILRK